MDDLQSYLFENSQDLPEGHYVKLMELLLKAHKQIASPASVPMPAFEITVPPYSSDYSPNSVDYDTRYSRLSYDYDTRRIGSLIRNYDTVRTIEISLGDWNVYFKDEDNFYNFAMKLKDLDTYINWAPTQYIFPNDLTSEDRQTIHIMANSYRRQMGTHTKRTLTSDTLHVFLSE